MTEPVSLRELVEQRFDAWETLYASNRATDQEAVRLALRAQQDLASEQKILVRKLESQEAKYPNKESLKGLVDTINERISRIESTQSRFNGGLVVIGIIGITNLVQLFSG